MAAETRHTGMQISGIGKFFFRAFTGAHAALYRLSGGRLGSSMGKVPVLVLHTVGGKSGKARENPLAYLRDGERFVVIGSAGGIATHPGWVHNLRHQPRATIAVGPRRIAVTASEASGAERERLWAAVVAMMPRFDEYRKQTSREIPVVVLTPVEAGR